jgi:hypothetical protein
MACDCAARLEDQGEEIDKVKTLLWGNGSPEKGHVVRLQRIEDAQTVMGDHVKKMSAAASKLFWTVLAGFLAMIGMIGADVFAAHWR